MLCGIWWKEVVIVRTEIKVIGVHKETVDIDVQSLLFWEPDFKPDRIPTVIVEHMEPELLWRDACEHHLVLSSSGHHCEEGGESLGTDVTAAAGVVLRS